MNTLPAEQLEKLPSLKTPDIVIAAVLIAVNLTGAWFLFNLKKTAVYFFYAALMLNVVTNAWYLTRRQAGADPVVLFAGVALGWLVAAFVCRFVTGLARGGVLR